MNTPYNSRWQGQQIDDGIYNAQIAIIPDDIVQTLGTSTSLIPSQNLLNIVYSTLNSISTLALSIAQNAELTSNNALILANTVNNLANNIYTTINNIRSPVTGIDGTIQKSIDDIFNSLNGGITALNFDNLQLTAQSYDSKNITASDYDTFGRLILIGGI